ncbi:MAG: hypothetical protein ACMZI0_05755 [Symbiopectobacterium sp.]|uniref:hypothetical protein n=1 Tax=Symbiopectobacterium sp. TaxID=2952789 RepID=UPI0039ED116E
MKPASLHDILFQSNSFLLSADHYGVSHHTPLVLNSLNEINNSSMNLYGGCVVGGAGFFHNPHQKKRGCEISQQRTVIPHIAQLTAMEI